ncbi:MAG TPA: DsbE family thiol:disulfide interchange protein [Xanthobacteraceae bacterium]|nr:DsbE family thiol:disulfide interchange protein [Xanthobacteraceae bacterium]
MTTLPQKEAPRRSLARRLIVLVPLAVFLVFAYLVAKNLLSGRDPTLLPSALIGHPAPQTPLPPVAGLVRDGQPVPGLIPADFIGAVTVVNVWASWCVPCHDEAALLVRLAADKRIRIVGINQKDKPDDARRFLGRYGDPYAAVGADQNGRASIEWGVYGVPENFIIGRDGKIAFKLVGPLTPDNLDRVFRPEIEKAIAATKTAAK